MMDHWTFFRYPVPDTIGHIWNILEHIFDFPSFGDEVLQTLQHPDFNFFQMDDERIELGYMPIQVLRSDRLDPTRCLLNDFRDKW